MVYSGATGDPLGPLAESITPLRVRFGFMEEQDVPAALRLALAKGLIDGEPDLDNATYFVSRLTTVATDTPGMAPWRKRLYVAMARNAADPADYFRLPQSQPSPSAGRSAFECAALVGARGHRKIPIGSRAEPPRRGTSHQATKRGRQLDSGSSLASSPGIQVPPVSR